MPNPIKSSRNAVIYSLVDGEPYVGIPPTRPVTVPVLLYARDSVIEPPTFDMEQVGDCTYVISANGYKTQDQDGLLVGSIDGEAQKWRIEYAERHDAYTIAKENDRGVGWVAPTDDERQVRVRVLIVGPSDPPFYLSDELFRFKYSD